LAGGVSRTTLEKRSKQALPVDECAAHPFSVVVFGIVGAATAASTKEENAERFDLRSDIFVINNLRSPFSNINFNFFILRYYPKCTFNLKN
jgi:hypothetical protein